MPGITRLWAWRPTTGKLTAVLAAALAAAMVMSAAAQAHGTHPVAATPAAPAKNLTPDSVQQPRYACPAAAPGYASCDVMLVPGTRQEPSPGTRQASPPTAPGPQPYLAADLRAAYHLPAGGSGKTIAIVDAFDDPAAEADLNAYRAANKIPGCDSSHPCFTKVNQQGQQGSYPPPDPYAGWEVEESLDLDMASAICPACRLLLVEANDASVQNLGLAVDEAVKLHATVISNSYGAAEYNGELADARHWNHPGIAITASTGDNGFGTQVPAAFSTVVAVGGTTLYHNASARGWAEQAWSGAGSGCSAWIPKPAWQHDGDCAMRTMADVSAVADPNTPVWVYDTYQTGGTWFPVGGTSVAAPVIAGIYALAGNAASISPGSFLAAHHNRLFDVTSGTNGNCGGGYLCTSQPGYDGPTGWGTPDGTGAF